MDDGLFGFLVFLGMMVASVVYSKRKLAMEEAAEEEAVSDTAGDPNGTHLDLWTFVELHGTFYRDMVEQWNEENPDKTIELTTITYPY